jgi:hypothetical protein
MGDDFDVFEVTLFELATTSGRADRLPLFIPQGHTWQVANLGWHLEWHSGQAGFVLWLSGPLVVGRDL